MNRFAVIVLAAGLALAGCTAAQQKTACNGAGADTLAWLVDTAKVKFAGKYKAVVSEAETLLAEGACTSGGWQARVGAVGKTLADDLWGVGG